VDSTRGRAIVAALAVVVAAALFVVLSSGEDEPSETASAPTTTAVKPDKVEEAKPPPPPKPKVPTIEIEGGQPAGGVEELTFEAGEEIRFRVRSDAPAHVHLHGYDVFEDVPAGGSTTFSVPADIEGVFEVEIETTATQIAEIVVEP
jgi:hypothetical protein